MHKNKRTFWLFIIALVLAAVCPGGASAASKNLSPVGVWEISLGGTAKGIGVATFSSNGELSGYVISDQPEETSYFSGSWSLAGNKISGSISTSDSYYTFTGSAVFGKSLSANAVDVSNKRNRPSFTGKPVPLAAASYSGSYSGRIKYSKGSFPGTLALAATGDRNRYTADCSFSVGGGFYRYSGDAIVDNSGTAYVVISGPGPDGYATAVFFGKFSKGKISFSWKSYDQDGITRGTGSMSK